MKISFFGASVTQQKQGYAIKLKNYFKNAVIQVFGYGGMHLTDAGIIYIDQVIEQGCDICFIDWFSTDYAQISEDTVACIDTIIYKFTKADCKLVFLFLPSQDVSLKQNFYNFCKTHLDKYGVAYIDVNNFLSYSPEILRDTVHTTEFGSNAYAKIIFDNFQPSQLTLPDLSNLLEPKYYNIKSINVKELIKKSFCISGNAEVLGFLLTVGPFSGVVKILAADNTKILINTWDRWCYYERNHFKIQFSLQKSATIYVTNQKFDTTRSKVNLHFEKIQKQLIVHKIYYIGDYLEINEHFYKRAIRKVQFYLRLSIIIDAAKNKLAFLKNK